MELLLLSNGVMHGKRLFEHAYDWIAKIVGAHTDLLFVPYAGYDLDAYEAEASEAMNELGFSCRSIHRLSNKKEAVANASAILVGGGNCFRLLAHLQREDLVGDIARRVREGAPYIGASAGSNIACPTIMTTNDMPIVWPASLNALGLIDFQINAHYLDADPRSHFMGETRQMRLAEFHEENTLPVLGLREGAGIRVSGDDMVLLGDRSARLFRRGQDPAEVDAGCFLSFLQR